ncbi:hypothetical protein VZT92_000267 [Zoarces viviparus]|uniref:Uncharacterized protein n=1 Tax=Zoarces viviparus TaxID=48416 RepID=A0AAW1G548_ZOAVI
MESNVLKENFALLNVDAEKIKAERQRFHKLIEKGVHQRNQLLHWQNELSVLNKKLENQGKELKWERTQNKALKDKLELVKKEKQSMEQRAVNHRAEQQRLKERLDQAIEQRDGLKDTLLRCRNECQELRYKASKIVNEKGGQCKEQMKQIHLLQLENHHLEREREWSAKESDADVLRRALQKCQKELYTQKVKLEEIKRSRAVGDHIGKEILIIQQRRSARRPSTEAPLWKFEALEKALLARTEQLRDTQKQCRELRDKGAEAAVRLRRFQNTVRDQGEKFKAVTAERNMYKGLSEQLKMELSDIKNGHRQSSKRTAYKTGGTLKV